MITLEQVKKDIEEGKSTMIYYSTHTLWWTHLASDVEEATKQGTIASAKEHEKILEDPNVSVEQKQRLTSLLKMANKFAVQIPMDPTGSPLYQMEDCDKWVSEAEKKPYHFGEHRLMAFMKSHHQNCEGKCFQKWERYNELITLEDIKNKLSNGELKGRNKGH